MVSDKPATSQGTGWSKTGWSSQPAGPYNPVSSPAGSSTPEGSTQTTTGSTTKPENEYMVAGVGGKLTPVSSAEAPFGSQKIVERKETPTDMILTYETRKAGLSGGSTTQQAQQGPIVSEAPPAQQSQLGIGMTQRVSENIDIITATWPIAKPISQFEGGILKGLVSPVTITADIITGLPQTGGTAVQRVAAVTGPFAFLPGMDKVRSEGIGEIASGFTAMAVSAIKNPFEFAGSLLGSSLGWGAVGGAAIPKLSKTEVKLDTTALITHEKIVPEGITYTSSIKSEAISKTTIGSMPLGAGKATAEATELSIVFNKPETIMGRPQNMMGTAYGKMKIGSQESPLVESGMASGVTYKKEFLNVEYGKMTPTPTILGEKGIMTQAGEKLMVTQSFSKVGAKQFSAGGILQETSRQPISAGELVTHKVGGISGRTSILGEMKTIDTTVKSAQGAGGTSIISTGGGMVQRQVFGDMSKTGFSVAKTSELASIKSSTATIGKTGGLAYSILGILPQQKTIEILKTQTSIKEINRTLPRETQSMEVKQPTASIEITRTLPTHRQAEIQVTRVMPLQSSSIKMMTKTLPQEITINKTLPQQGLKTATIQKTISLQSQLQSQRLVTHSRESIINLKREQIIPSFSSGGLSYSFMQKPRISTGFGKKQTKYTPSVVAISLDIRGAVNTKGLFSGLEIRPIPTSRRRRKRQE